MYDIESDGSNVTSQRDPPGQRSVYVAPGDPERETYRLSTFHHYPRDSPIDPRQLAAHGFYFTGYRDRVKCFSCGQCCENWLVGDDVTSSEWHQLDCDFINGRDTRNIPLLSFWRQRQSTRNNVHSSSVNRSNTSLADHHQATSQQPSADEQSTSRPSSNMMNQNNGQSSSYSNNLETVYRRAPTSPSMVVSPATNHRRRPSDNLRDLFPCLHPINSHMRSKEGRLQTFLDNSSIWPAHRIRATPQQIVDAGMYYLGERDRVKCWYCNGGLQNWERDDNPWEEHAKWFPLCEHVLQQKGPDFVHEIVARFPGLRRPTLYNPSSGQAAQSLVRILNSGSNQMSRTPRQIGLTSQPAIIDPRQEIAERNRKISEEMRSAVDVAQARTMGFGDKVIKEALKRQYESNKQGFANFHDLVEAILSVPVPSESNESQNEIVEFNNESSSGASRYPNSSEEPNLTPLEEMRKLEASRKCKKCHREDACVVFIPCGHLACCVMCSDKIQRCPVCKEFIGEKLRSFIS